MFGAARFVTPHTCLELWVTSRLSRWTLSGVSSSSLVGIFVDIRESKDNRRELGPSGHVITSVATKDFAYTKNYSCCNDDLNSIVD